AAKNGSSFATMRTIGSTQVGCFSQKNRFCRLTELQSILSNGLGTTAGEKVIRNTFTFEMNPDPVSDAELASAYVVTATSNVVGETVYKYELTEKGEIKQLLP
ncbi:MAG: hypothetical protein ACRD6X_21385, partial [Pyrinomonadaceae bacterium]